MTDSHRRRRQRRRTRIARRRRVAILAVVVAASTVAVGAGTIGGAAAVGSNCDLNALTPVGIGENSFVFAADGTLLGSIPAEKNRQPIGLKAMSPWLPKATIAIEDRRFYDHGGIDVEGITRALIEDIRARKVVQGGSTITQQLVRNLYKVSNERTIERKMKEACLAIKLNRAYSKSWILENYLNVVYYGSQAYGVEAAAQTYFSKSARRLNLPQAALLAGLIQAPSRYDPFRNPSAAIARRNRVLRAMVETGAITEAEFRAVHARPLGLKAGKLYKEIKEPYFFGYVRDELIGRYGAETVRSGGLRVYTTIDRGFQRIANRVMRETLYLKTDPAAALVAIDPRTGAIRAMAALSRRKGNQYNLVSQARRQAGSTFKTFVLAAAVEMGIDPDSTPYLSAPFRYIPESTDSCEDEKAWCPETYDHSYIGVTDITRATLRSDNTVFARLTLDVGPERVVRMARKLGIRTSPLDVVPAVGLGAASISPLEMASAYATLAANGIYSRPTAIRRVVLPGGKEDVDAGWGKVARERVIPDWVAYEITKVLEQNVLYGTGYPNAVIGRPAAGKTGTTDNHADAWFCGYTPGLATTVWMGHPRGQVPMLSVHGIRVAGGTFPAEMWGKFMREALDGLPVRNWRYPSQEPVWQYFRGEYALEGSYDDDDDGYDSGYDSGGYTPPADEPSETPRQAPARPKPQPAPAPVPAPVPTPVPEPEPVPEPPPPAEEPG